MLQQSPQMCSHFYQLSVMLSVRCSIAFLLVLSDLLVGLHCANEEGRGIVDAPQLQLTSSGALDGGGGEVISYISKYLVVFIMPPIFR